MDAVIENHQGMLLSLLSTTYKKITDCKGRHSMAVIQMKSLAYLSYCAEHHFQSFPVKLLMENWRLFDKRLKGSYSKQNKFQ